MFIAPPEDSPESTKLYEASAAGRGFVMNLTRAWAWRPEVFEGFNALCTQLARESSFRKRELALMVSAAAAELGDSYCALAWGQILAREAGAEVAAAVIADAPAAGLSTRDRALTSWARKVVRDPNATTAADVQALRDAGLAEREIFEATVFIALRQAFSTVNDALGVDPDQRLLDGTPAPVRAAVDFGRAPSGPRPAV